MCSETVERKDGKWLFLFFWRRMWCGAEQSTVIGSELKFKMYYLYIIVCVALHLFAFSERDKHKFRKKSSKENPYMRPTSNNVVHSKCDLVGMNMNYDLWHECSASITKHECARVRAGKEIERSRPDLVEKRDDTYTTTLSHSPELPFENKYHFSERRSFVRPCLAVLNGAHKWRHSRMRVSHFNN